MLLRTLQIFAICYFLSVVFAASPLAVGDDLYDKERKALIAGIEQDVRETSFYLKKEALAPQVLEAMTVVPRHEFVPKELRKYAYQNRPLPIGYGQTISQPYIVAIMTDLLAVSKNDRVLEIGTGSGYQAAVLAELAGEVYSIEIIEPLGNEARNRLQKLQYENVEIRIGDGYYGWEEHAPFDAIMVTAAASHVPPPLIQQLKPGGTMLIPVGSRFTIQQLVLISKDTDGNISSRQILPVMFVPLTGGH